MYSRREHENATPAALRENWIPLRLVGAI